MRRAGELTWLVLSYVATVLGFILAIVFLSHVIRQQNTPAGTLAWLLAIVLIPYVGVPLYLMIGGRKMRRAAGRKCSLAPNPGPADALRDSGMLDRLLRSYGVPGATTNNSVRLCGDGEQAYRELIDLIDASQHTLRISTYILSADDVAREVVEHLVGRVRQGVEVRLLLDDFGCLRKASRLAKTLHRAGGRVARFMPLLHVPFKARTNLRNHRKIAVADSRRVISGGRNIAREYLGPTAQPGRWADLSFVIEGPAAATYADIFDADWRFASREPVSGSQLPAPHPPGGGGHSICQVVPSGPDAESDALYDAVLTAIYSAQRRLWIATPYFVPDPPLDQALEIAAHRGVDVRVVLPKRSNHPLIDAARTHHLRRLQQAGASVLLFDPGMMHAKAILVDDEVAILGSANFDVRSFFLNYEVGLFLYSPGDVETTARWFSSLQRQTQVAVLPAGRVRAFAEGLVHILEPLL